MRMFVFAIVVIAMLYPVAAQTQRTFSYQGVLTDSLGNPKPDGSYSFTFRLYDVSSGGAPLWSEQKTLAVARGLFHTTLGDQVQIGPGLTFDQPYWLGIVVGTGTELAPRIPLTSVGHSLSSTIADTARYAINAPLQAYVDSARSALRSDTSLFAMTTPQQGIVDSARIAGAIANNAITSFSIADSTIMGEDVNSSSALNVKSITAANMDSTGPYAYRSGLFTSGLGLPRQTYATLQTEQFGIAEAAWFHSAYAAASYPVLKLLKNPSSSVNFLEGRTSDETLQFSVGGSGGAWFGGKVGIGAGVTNPFYQLEVNGIINATDIYKNGTPAATQWTTSFPNIYYNTGNVGVGVANPTSRLQIKDGSGTSTFTSASLNIENFTSGEAIWVRNASSSNTSPVIKMHQHPSSTASFVEGIAWDGVSGSTRKFHITSAGTYVAGSDFAEAFEASGGKAAYEPGDVVVLSEKNPKAIEKSTAPYDTKVAGIYSTRPGVLGADKDGVTRMDENDIPVAIVGIVPTKVTDENGVIKPGDLLTTSSIAGHAMKASPTLVNGVAIYPTGTILGKALEPLQGKVGVVKVLVMLR